jgi:hypothetical protein
MKTLSADETTQYLEQVIKIEISLRNLKSVRQNILDEVRHLDDELRTLRSNPSTDKIIKPTYRPPLKPQKPSEPTKYKSEASFTLLGMVARGIATASANRDEQRKYESSMARYNQLLSDYNREKQTYETKYKAAMDEYRQKCKIAEENDKQKRINYPDMMENGRSIANALDAKIQSTEKVLSQLYDVDVIFPKYRELVCLCSMYEYFVTGRVSELKGAAGAYNLYESELRQNLIITELKNIGTKLEQIKKNQYVLYSELKKSNAYLSSINSNVKASLETLSRIEDSVELSNMISKNIADNTEAIKYISFVSMIK